MKKNRPKSKNIIDKRTPKKIRNNTSTISVYHKNRSGGMTEKGIFKMRDFEFMKIQPSGKKKSKYTKKKITHEKV